MDTEVYYRDHDLTVRSMEKKDCQAFADGFAAQGWSGKDLAQYERYLREQESGARQVIVGEWQGETAGYATLLPRAEAGPFADKPWPEICDFNVLEKFQRRGIGHKIMDAAEQLAARVSDTVCLGVGLYGLSGAAGGYGTAQRMYSKRGFVPDGSGLWYRDKPLEPYTPCVNDDDLVLYLSKKVQRRELRPLTENELGASLFACFDRFQTVERCWRKIEGKWVVKDIAFTERWSEEDYAFLVKCLKNTLCTGGEVWGAFLDGKLKGFCSVEGMLLGSGKQYADLSSIHVSADARGTGMGRLLFQKAQEAGKRLGAKKLYISAHSSVESQAFYKRMGCVEAAEYDPHHVEQEPCDCQLECEI